MKKHMIAATLLAVGTTAAQANVELLTIETLMHAQATEVLALSLVSPPALNETLQYSYAVNTDDGSFAYQTLAGQTYNGLALSVSGTGTYDAGTNTYNWSSSGMLGSQTWAQSGQAPWVGDPTAAVSGDVSVNGHVVGTVSGNLDVDAMGHSSGTVTFTPPGGTPSSYDVTDYVPGSNQPWTLRWKDHTGQFVPTAATWVNNDQTGGVYQGTSTFTVAAVPEPSTWALLVVSLLVLVGTRARTKSAD